MLSIILGVAQVNYVLAEDEVESALKVTPSHEDGMDVYEVCSACHLPEGWGTPDGTFPQISGQHINVTIKQLADIRAGNRDNPTMLAFASPQEIGGVQSIADVSEYIATLPMTPANGRGPGDNLAHGEKLYKELCVECHGANGEGDNDEFYPRIHGQHYEYLLRQQLWMKAGKRRNVTQEKLDQLLLLSEGDIAAISDYVSRLFPPDDMVAEEGWLNPDFD